jgi:hypothetical protein
LPQGATANSNQVEDTTGYTPDESEYNDLNTDRELFALRAVAQVARKDHGEEVAACIFPAASRATELRTRRRCGRRSTRRCARTWRFTAWTRAVAGDLAAGRRIDGQPARQRRIQRRCAHNNMNANFATQEVMGTLSSDTGGKAFFDSNDFAPAFAQVSAILRPITRSAFARESARDGSYRKLTIKVNRPGVKLEYRPGYYAPADFKHSGKEDRERELEEQLASDLPATDMASIWTRCTSAWMRIASLCRSR